MIDQVKVWPASTSVACSVNASAVGRLSSSQVALTAPPSAMTGAELAVIVRVVVAWPAYSRSPETDATTVYVPGAVGGVVVGGAPEPLTWHVTTGAGRSM